MVLKRTVNVVGDQSGVINVHCNEGELQVSLGIVSLCKKVGGGQQFHEASYQKAIILLLILVLTERSLALF